jgi:IS605 OrfB family transposase
MKSLYSLRDPLLFKRDGQLFLAVVFETPEPIPDPNGSCVGVDLGLKRLAVTSDGLVFKGTEFLKAKRKVRYHKACLRATMRERKSNSAAKRIKKLARKERNVTKQYLHAMCNAILASTGATTIVLEDLSGIKKEDKGKKFNNRQSQVPYYKTKIMLTYKAQALGKRVETVNPAYTSKDDYRDIPRGVRKGCRYYASDGVVLDSDHNGAINIAKRWVVQNELPISFADPIRGRQTLWAGCSQSANRGDAPRIAISGISLAHKPPHLCVG